MPALQMAQTRRRLGLLVREVLVSAQQGIAGERGVVGGAACPIRWGMGLGLHYLFLVCPARLE